MTDSEALTLALCLGGIGAGLFLLWRGFGGYRAAVHVGDTATSRIESLAAGEVRVTGTIEPAEVTVTSPLQARECVWYRSRVTVSGDDDDFDEERGVGFRLTDGSGSIRVFPRGARVDAEPRLDEHVSGGDEAPASITFRPGSAFDTSIVGDREAAIAALLTVRRPETDPDPYDVGGDDGHGRHYEEARLEVGDVITVVGSAVPFGHLADPAGADLLERTGDPLVGLDDPIVAMNIAEAREAGILTTPEEAWGNAAIPGFGIGRPVSSPELEPGVTPAVLATPAQAEAIRRTFDIEPDLLVLAAAPDAPLLIAAGSPGDVVAREQGRFLQGLLGAVLAIGSAVAGAIALGSAG